MNEEKLPDLGLEVGDKVELAGVVGEVNSIYSDRERPIAVWFEYADITRWFLPDGRVEPWHKIPSLKLIKKKIKPKRKVTLYSDTFKFRRLFL